MSDPDEKSHGLSEMLPRISPSVADAAPAATRLARKASAAAGSNAASNAADGGTGVATGVGTGVHGQLDASQLANALGTEASVAVVTEAIEHDPRVVRRGGALWFMGEVPEGAPKGVPLSLVPALVGRSKHADIILSEPSISLRHAEIAWDARGFSIMDLGSRSGTLVNGSVVRGQTRLNHGDVIALGKMELRFRRAEALPALKPPPEPPPPPPEATTKTEHTKSFTERLPTSLMPKARPGEDPAHLRMRERVRVMTAAVILLCVALLTSVFVGRAVYTRLFQDKSPAQIRAQIAALLADGKQQLVALDVDAARASAQSVLALDELNIEAQSLLKTAQTESEARDALALALRLGDEERDDEARQILQRIPNTSIFAPQRDRLLRSLSERALEASRRNIEMLLDKGMIAEALAAAEAHVAQYPDDVEGKELLARAQAAKGKMPMNPQLAAARAKFAAGDFAAARAIAADAGFRSYVRDLDRFTGALQAGKAALKKFDEAEAVSELDDAYRLCNGLGGTPTSATFADVREPYARALLLQGTGKMHKGDGCGGARDVFRAARAMPSDRDVQFELSDLSAKANAGLQRAKAAKIEDPARAAAAARDALCYAQAGSATYQELRAIAGL